MSIQRWLKNLYSITAVNERTFSHGTSQIAGSDKGQVELSDVCH
jgi:hypothetical protein